VIFTAANSGFCASAALGCINRQFCISELLFGLDQHRQTLVLNIYLYQKPGIGSGGRNSNATPAQSPVVSTPFFRQRSP